MENLYDKLWGSRGARVAGRWWFLGRGDGQLAFHGAILSTFAMV